MTETATREDLEIFLKDSPGCETVHQPCPEPVAWLSVTPCCNYRKVLCNTHKKRGEEKDQEILRNHPLYGGMAFCFNCQELAMPSVFFPI